jgi:undecaprenyl-diphosphatase
MKANGKRILFSGILLITVFAIWTLAVLTVDVKPSGANGTSIGFAALNVWFHEFTGVHMNLYIITDWLGLVPVAACILFGIVGLTQGIKRKSLWKVDYDIIILGIYYIVVITEYLLFEMIPINYRPVLINGFMEVSYPSSTTLLVLSVMPTCIFQANRRIKNTSARKMLSILISAFSTFMVAGRLISGVHWLTDIIGAILLSVGSFYIYKGIVLMNDDKNRRLRNGIS